MDQALLRSSNLALVARTVFAADPSPTRADVATATSMTRSTVSRLVDDLVAGGVLRELTRVVGPGPGRPGTPLAPGTDRFVALGLQVNVGYLAALVVDLSGTVLAQHLVTDDLRGSAPAPVLERLVGLAAAALAELPQARVLVGAGLALPGIVSAGSGTLLRAPNLGWSDLDVAGLVDRDRLRGAAVTIGNEADLASATVTRTRPGHPSPLQDVIYLSGETGIGGTVVVDGESMHGRHGWAGEIGHVTVDPAGPACPCGSTGCLEQYAGKRALLAAAGLAPEAPASQLADAVRAGAAGPRSAVDRAAWALGVALAGVVNVVDVPSVVLGGHLRELADVLRPRLEQTLRERVLSARWVTPTVEPSGPGAAPGALGAAYLELERVVADPAVWL